MIYNTVRQFSKSIAERRGLYGLNLASKEDELLYLPSIIQNFLSLSNVNSREEYLEWLNVWGHLHTRLVSLIKQAKKGRLQESNNYWFSCDGTLNELRVLARAMYTHRTFMKDASQCAKFKTELAEGHIKIQEEFSLVV